MVIYIYIDYTLHLWVLKHLSFSPLFHASPYIPRHYFIFIHLSTLFFLFLTFSCTREPGFSLCTAIVRMSETFHSAKIYLSTCLVDRFPTNFSTYVDRFGFQKQSNWRENSSMIREEIDRDEHEKVDSQPENRFVYVRRHRRELDGKTE